MLLEIVVHNYRYPHLGVYQPSSLALYPPKALDVEYTLVYSPQDLSMTAFAHWLAGFKLDGVKVTPFPVDVEELTRRAIVRNWRARSTAADWIWFADCDYSFGPDCLDSLHEAIRADPGKFFYPKYAFGSIDHAEGDRAIADAAGPPCLRNALTYSYAPQYFNRAIGGLQIVRGDLAREKGYADTPKHQQRGSKHYWHHTHDDVGARRAFGQAKPVELKSLYRIRHSRRGQDSHGVLL